MSISGSGERITYKCSYCGSAIASFYDPYRFTDICPNCHGSVLIPRRDAPPPTMPTDANFPTSGEFPQVSFGHAPVAAAPSGTLPKPTIATSATDIPAVSIPPAHNPRTSAVMEQPTPPPPVAPKAEVPNPPETPAPPPPQNDVSGEHTRHAPHLSIFKHPEDRASIESRVQHAHAAPPRPDETTQFKPLSELLPPVEPPAPSEPQRKEPPSMPDPTASVRLDASLQDLPPVEPNQLRDAAQASEPVPSQNISTIYRPIDPMHDELMRAYGPRPVAAPLFPPSPVPKDAVPPMKAETPALVTSLPPTPPPPAPPAPQAEPAPTVFGGFTMPFKAETPTISESKPAESMPQPATSTEASAPSAPMNAQSDPASSALKRRRRQEPNASMFGRPPGTIRF